MFALFADSFLLFAQGQQQQGGPGFWDSIILFLPLLLIFFWFFLLRPQQKQEEKQKKLINSLEKNDRVMTVGGLLGTIHLVDKERNEIVLKVDDGNGTKIRFVLSAIHSVLPKEETKS